MIMKKMLIAGLVLGAACLVPQATQAAVSVDLHFGTSRHGNYRNNYHHRGHSSYHHHSYPYRHHSYHRNHSRSSFRGFVSVYPQPVYVPERVVVVERRQPQYVEPSYYDLGRDWAKDLRRDVVSWGDFIRFLKDNNIQGSSRRSNDFRDGFVSAYGVNGDAAFRRAIRQACD
jgi:hypothetical protein